MRTPLAIALALTLALTPLFTSANASAAPQDPGNSQDAPQYPSQDYPQQPQGNPPADNSQVQGNPAPDKLDNLLSPIALYPDPLLAQVLVASTFPDQIAAAASYGRANGANGIDEQNWDVSVRAVAHYPTVVEMMADKIDWTTSLGQAYVNQSTDVSTAVQRLRHEARRAGNLQTTQQQEVLENGDYIAINPYSPQYIYVPTYDPAVVYFSHPYWGPAISFGFGFPIGGWLNLGFHWGWGGGFGGIFYTGWNPLGWGRGCWNCGWIGRSRGFVNFHNNMYVNNRFNNININRGVLNRSVNVNNLNRFNSIHRNVGFNNVQANNARMERNAGRSFAGANNNGFHGAQNSGTRSFAANNMRNDRPPANSNVNRGFNNNRANDVRPRENNAFNNRPNNAQQNRGFQQASRPAPQASRPAAQARSFQQNSVAGAFNRPENKSNARQSSRQVSRPQAQHSAPRVRQASSHGGSQGGSHGGGHAAHSSHGGGGGHKHK